MVLLASLALTITAHGQAPARSADAAAPDAARPFSVVEASLADLRAALDGGRTTSHEIVQQYLTRIALYEHRLNAAIAINPRALVEADALDAERRAGRSRGPLHGIPIALKDNVHTLDMPTTGGALAFAGLMAPYEATLTRNLRQAGAIILAKTVMTELANWVAGAMPTNYSSLGGFGFNPYDPRRDPREGTFDGRPVLQTGGSSSGIGTAASFWAGNVGTETSGSILSPSNQNMLVGIKPTVGRISRHGVIPITADQDTPGPMTRTVADAAIMFGVLEGSEPDRNDPAHFARACTPAPGNDYTRYLDRGALKGARIGIPRSYFYDAMPGRPNGGGLTTAQRALMIDAIRVLQAQGAVIVDPAEIPSIVTTDRDQNILLFPTCSGSGNGKGNDSGCSVVFKYGMKRDFNQWLASLGTAAPVKSLSALRAWNTAHERAGTLKYGQAQLDISDEMDLEQDRARYLADRAKDVALGGRDGIDAALQHDRLDALLFPGPSGAFIAAKPGYPTVIVPFGTVPNAPTPPLPDGFNARPSPYGVSFTGTACSEPKLIALAYAFEQATKKRVAPDLVGSR